MFPRHSSTAICAAPRGRQRGVYALEWAIIFPVFFMLLYAIVSYGLAFLVRESMQFAAEDGARTALRYDVDRTIRLNNAKTAVVDRLSWLPTPLRPSIGSVSVNLCQVGNPDNCSPTQTCGIAVEDRCLIVLSFSIPYGRAPLAPSLRMFNMSVFAPERLSASASVLVDRGGI